MSRQTVKKAVFILSLFVALILGLTDPSSKEATYLESLLVIGGLVVGILSVGPSIRKDFLIAAAIFIFLSSDTVGASSVLGKAAPLGQWLGRIFTGVCHFIVGVTIVACLKEIYSLYVSEDPNIFKK